MKLAWKIGKGALAVAIRAIPEAYTMKTLWWWFVVPLGALPLSMAHAYGLDILITWATLGFADVETMLQKDNSLTKLGGELRVVLSIAIWAVCLLYGVVAHLLMVRGW